MDVCQQPPFPFPTTRPEQSGTADPYVVLRDDRPTYCGLRSNAMYQTPALPKHLTGLFDEDMDAWIVDADDLNDEHEMEFEVWLFFSLFVARLPIDPPPPLGVPFLFTFSLIVRYF